jgi:nucleotide-binding universal stress UspA family protein
MRAEAQGTVERFHERARALGVEAEFDFAEGAASEIMLWAARLHDLTVIEQRDPAGDELGYDPAEQTALSSGRPVLVTPREGVFSAAPKHLVVAWNGSREAAAAVQAARPFIEKAKRVTVLIGSEKHGLRSSARVPDLSIRSYLERHVASVTQEAVKVSPDDAGAHLLARCAALEADMLVMGIYGRSWFSELILGGATRHVLQNMRLPVLMAH